ncbi:Chaperone protein dnaJ [Zostera marina]|uniref:Chaperone protein dnaJ n=1 Tax=Zostera marina TaxID=29655 RepID=A0A0K9Q0R5_ZOSMR|nr:Chaperone protein dnaJ [Zostera marina]
MSAVFSSSVVRFPLFSSSTSAASSSSRHGPRSFGPRASAIATSIKQTEKNPYEVLKVKETATVSEIKTAYRSLAKIFHPDAVGSGLYREDEFIQIHDAYATLSDPDARAKYDRSSRLGAGFAQSTTRFGDRVRTRRWETDQCW